MRCEQIMRRPVRWAAPSEGVLAAARTMRDANIGFLPVCDQQGHVQGVVTDRDLAMRVLAQGRDPERTSVGTVMSQRVITCAPQDDLRQAQRLMARAKVSRIVVVSPEMKVLGVVSLSDVAAEGAIMAADTLARVASREVLDTEGRRVRQTGRVARKEV